MMGARSQTSCSTVANLREMSHAASPCTRSPNATGAARAALSAVAVAAAVPESRVLCADEVPARRARSEEPYA